MSFTGIVKIARDLSHHCDITYAGTASNLPPEIQVDHVHVNIHMLCICYLLPPPCTLDRGITKILTFPLPRSYICPALRGLNLEPLVTVSAHQYVPRSTSVLVGSKHDIAKALPTLTRVPICQCYHRSHETMVALPKYGLNISKTGNSFELLPSP